MTFPLLLRARQVPFNRELLRLGSPVIAGALETAAASAAPGDGAAFELPLAVDARTACVALDSFLPAYLRQFPDAFEGGPPKVGDRSRFFCAWRRECRDFVAVLDFLAFAGLPDALGRLQCLVEVPQGAAYGVTHDAFCTCRAEFARAPDKLAHVSEAMEFMFKFEALCRPFVDQIVTSYTNPSPISKDALRDLARAHHPAPPPRHSRAAGAGPRSGGAGT